MLEVWRRSRGLLRWLRRQRRGWLGIVLAALRRTFTLESSFTAAAIAYFALFSVFPLVLFTMTLARTWLEPILDRSEIIAQLDFIAPTLGQLLQTQLARIAELEEAITGVSLLTLIWSASSIFYVLRRTLDRIWDVGTRRPVWHHRGMAIFTVVALSLLLLTASLVYSIFISIVDLLTPHALRQFGGVASILMNVAVSILLFAILYRLLPHFPVDWRDVLPGAIGAGVLWEIAKRIFLFYATNYLLARLSLTQLIYGSVATIIGFLAWSYVSSFIFIFGAYINVGYVERRRRLEAAKQTSPARR
ncbi:MAG: YihY/virulence factor BrkB family protein [Candidatus Promineifilaceae bacterium]|nr:YihY/virulence factor BrkB family protein [Candidatus Promineifilaceae bacterium]